MNKMCDTTVTFSVNCTYTVNLPIPENATDDEIEALAWEVFDNIDTGDLGNVESDILMVEQY